MEENDRVYLNPEVFLSGLNDLEYNYYDFLDQAFTFNGWILTLNAEELEQVEKEFRVQPNSNPPQLPPKYTILEYIRKGINEFSHAEFVEDLMVKRVALKKIKACKAGLMKYIPAEEDGEWRFEVIYQDP